MGGIYICQQARLQLFNPVLAREVDLADAGGADRRDDFVGGDACADDEGRTSGAAIITAVGEETSTRWRYA